MSEYFAQIIMENDFLKSSSNVSSRFYDWEFDLICSEQKKDVNMWLNLAEMFDDPILELCCGSGRITIPLSEKGFKITALDNSVEMLQLLKEKTNENIEIIESDMTSFHLEKKYRFAFISYSSFQQLLSKKEQIKCLKNIHKHLKNGGVLGIDINPCICEPDVLTKTHLYTAWFQPNNSTVSMFTSHKIDWKNGIKHWQDTYVEIDKKGNETVYQNHVSLKECNHNYMINILEECGFTIIDIFGDFKEGQVTKNSNNIIYLSGKKLI